MNDRTRAAILKLGDCLNRRDAAAACELLAENVLFWEPTYGEPRRGRAAVRREFEGFFAMLPDIKFTTLTIMVEGNVAFHEWRYRATYQGRPIQLQECAVIQFNADNLIEEVRIYFDRLSLLRQLGLMQEE